MIVEDRSLYLEAQISLPELSIYLAECYCTANTEYEALGLLSNRS